MVMSPVHQVWPQTRGKKTRQTEEEGGRQHQGLDRPGVQQVPEGSGEQGKMEKTECKIICGAPMTLAVKGLMMMMMMITNYGLVQNFPLMPHQPLVDGKHCVIPRCVARCKKFSCRTAKSGYSYCQFLARGVNYHRE